MTRLPAIVSLVAAVLLNFLSVSPSSAESEAQSWNSQPAGMQSSDARVAALLKQLTLDEKIKLMSGTKDEMHVPGIERLHIPELKFSDGPVGVRCWGKSTAYPCGAMLAATWDKELSYEIGQALGRDCRARGVHVLIGPGVDLYRVAQCGRNFEYFGEDPYLSARIAVPWIKGVQDQGVATSVKHFAANDQETLRDSVNTIVDERRLHEICLPPFKAAVEEANAATVMAAYNKVNGHWCTANKYLLDDVLRKKWDYKGVLMSDWGAVHECLGPLTAGCDLEMGRTVHYTPDNIKKYLQEGKVTQDQIDEHVRRILNMTVSMGFMDRPQEDKSIPANDPASAAVALKVAREGLVLLKNDKDFLPLDRTKVNKVVVLGPNASPAVIGGGGSSEVGPFDNLSLLDAMKASCGERIAVTHVPFEKDQKQILNAEQEAAIRGADVVVASVGFSQQTEYEGKDRPYDLPSDQIDLLQKIALLSKKVVVVLNCGGNVGMNAWIKGAPALLHAWYPGQNGNKAVAEAVFGELNPSGRLPDTFEEKWEDSPACKNFPGDAANGGTVKYDEGIFIGYRAENGKRTAPRFPFGYGLSYSKFAFENLKVEPAGTDSRGKTDRFTVSVDVKNTSSRDGAVVAQLYVMPSDTKSPVARPAKELKGFERVELKAGESKTIVMKLDSGSFAYYDVDKHDWVTPAGAYSVGIGSSCRDMACNSVVQL